LPDTHQIICGIDPGLRTTGYAVLRVHIEDESSEIVEAGVIRCSPQAPLQLRLAELAANLNEILDENRVDVVAVEQVYSHYKRPRTAILMAHARGVILLEAAQHGAQVVNLAATAVKKHLTGNGRAPKDQVQRAVAQILSLPKPPEPPDVADALAIALCASVLLSQPAKLAMVNDDLLVD
jgi:crossover junction endodeoxyribonuclease RuvC